MNDNHAAGNRPALDPARLKSALLQPHGAFARVEVVESTGSTNVDLATAAASADQFWPDLSVLIANEQEAGKGRLGRAWSVPAGAAMISSVFLQPGPVPAFAASGYAWLSILAGVALCETISSHTDIPAALKWPNDVVVNGRKLAGILAQVVPATQLLSPPAASGADSGAGAGAGQGMGVVVGAGVNVGALAHELPTDRATSLQLEGATGSHLDRNVLLPAYLNGFAKLYQDFAAAGGDAAASLDGGLSLLERACERMSTLGQQVRAELPGGTMLHGVATGLAGDGGLQLRENDGSRHTVSAGDVIHLRRTDSSGAVAYA